MKRYEDDAVSEMLDRAVPERTLTPRWDDVLRRSTEARGGGHGEVRSFVGRRSRPGLVMFAGAGVATALVCATVAVGAATGWWFTGVVSAPTPATAVLIASRGIWLGQPWELETYSTQKGDVCYALTPGGAANMSGQGGALTCTTISPTGTQIAYLTAGGSEHLAPFIVGVVVDAAARMHMDLTDGSSREVETTAAPDELGLPVRFFTLFLPPGVEVQTLTAIAPNGDAIASIDVASGTRNAP